MYQANGMEYAAMQRQGVATMGNERPMEYSRMLPRMRTNMNFGREKLPWSQEIWARIDQAVHTECRRTKVARKFLPLYGPIDGGQTTIHSDTVAVVEQSLSVDETATTPLVEIVADFKLTAQQVDREEELMTAVTLAGRAGNLISQGADVLIFQGQEAVEQHPLFVQKKVRLLSGNAGTGLLNGLSDIQIVEVDPSSGEGDELRFGEKTFEAVAKAYSRLQSGDGLAQAHYGPYALVLNFVQYADSLAPLEKTLIMPADRITSLVEFYGGTGTLPPFTGLLVSTGGNTMDLVVGIDVMTTFLQEDPDGRYRFRVYERFALRLKDETARIRLDFQQQVSHSTKSKRLAQAV